MRSLIFVATLITAAFWVQQTCDCSEPMAKELQTYEISRGENKGQRLKFF